MDKPPANPSSPNDELIVSTEEFLHEFAREYKVALERKPASEEFFSVLRDAINMAEMENVFSDCDGLTLESIAIKTKKRRTRQEIRPGDVVSIPLSNSSFCFIWATPQERMFDVFYLRARTARVRTNALKGTEVRHFEHQIASRMINKGTWKVVGNLPYSNPSPKAARGMVTEVYVVDFLEKMLAGAPVVGD